MSRRSVVTSIGTCSATTVTVPCSMPVGMAWRPAAVASRITSAGSAAVAISTSLTGRPIRALRTAPPTMRVSAPSVSSAANTLAVAGRLSHSAFARLGMRPSFELDIGAPRLIEVARLDAAVLERGGRIGLARNAAGARAEGHEHDEDDDRAGDEQPDQGRVVEHARRPRLFLARHVDVGDVHD